LAEHLRTSRDAGKKLLVPYITGGLGSDWVATLEAVSAAGADAIEVGLPFSDPMIDGPVIQRASVEALAHGATAQGIIAEIAKADVSVPVAVMTYYNVVLRTGHHRMSSMLAEAGITGAILPDLPVDEIGPWAAEADRNGVATILLAAPTTPDVRLKEICLRARGFLYAVGLMGVTGERQELAESAGLIAARCKAATDLPVLVGVGISTPAQAADISRIADGVAVGSALVHRILDGAGPDGAAQLVREFRQALDG
jgi:tryptophan synthase alpha chain